MDAKPTYGDWQPISTAQKNITYRTDGHGYGDRIVVYIPAHGRIVTCRWWKADDDPDRRACNFLDDSGNAVFPSHWMPVPASPAA